MTLIFNSVLKATGILTGQTTENRIRKTKLLRRITLTPIDI